MLLIIAIYKRDQSCAYHGLGNFFLYTEFCVFLHHNPFTFCLRMSSFIFRPRHFSVIKKVQGVLGRGKFPYGESVATLVYFMLRTQRLESLYSGALCQFCSAPTSMRLILLFSFLTYNFFTVDSEIFQKKQSKTKEINKL